MTEKEGGKLKKNHKKEILKNIKSRKIEESEWSQEDLSEALKNLAKTLEDDAVKFQDWYMERKEIRKKLSLLFRILAIIFVLLGGIYPILLNMKIDLLEGFPTLGYLFFGIAASCITSDKLLCVSSGWKRYVDTSLKIGDAHRKFQLEWGSIRAEFRDCFRDETSINKAFHELKRFSNEINSLMIEETEKFFDEFQRIHTEIEKTVQKYDQSLDRKKG